jgi:hypothetical protein
MQTGKAGGGVSHEVSGAAGAVDATVASVASGRAVPEAVAPAASGVDRKAAIRRAFGRVHRVLDELERELLGDVPAHRTAFFAVCPGCGTRYDNLLGSDRYSCGPCRKRGAEHIAEVQMFWSQP